MTSKVGRNYHWIVNMILSWQFLSFILAVGFGGIGFVATKSLLELPDRNTCNNLSLWFTSATNRIYCAQVKAENNTVEDLLAAIALLDDYSDDHPLNHEFKRHIKKWTNDILALANKKLEQGDLESAIAIARQIPQTGENKITIEEKVKTWRDIWQKGKAIEAQVDVELRDSQWNKALLVAVKLLNIDNSYWQETRYQDIVKTINLAQEQNKQLDDAYVSIENGGIENLLKTIEIASAIKEDSYSYEEAQKLMAQAELGITEIAEKLVDAQDWYKLGQLANEIASSSQLNSQALDWKTIARAGKYVDLGTVSGVELAIAEVEQISTDSKVYIQARQLVQSWSEQKDDIANFANAKNLAKSGQISDLNAAIAQAQLVNSGASVYDDAQRQIQSWQKKVQTLEDTPILDRAKLLAQNNTIEGWKSAISQARQIGYNRALHSEAKNLIEEWQTSIETVEDKPILNEAIALGNKGEYQAAINTANRIGRGRALYREAQSKARQWRIEITAQQNLNTAYRVASNNDVQSLVRAISLARRIPSSSSVSFQGRQAVDLWSERLLNIAQKTASTYNIPDLERAVNLARNIPSGSSAYGRAQKSINEWRQQLYPALDN